MNLMELVAKLSLDSSEYEYGLSIVQQGIDKFKKFTIASVGAASAAFVAFAQDAVRTGMGFDSAMSQVAATMGVSVDQIQDLRDFAQQMGATTKFTATEAAEALNYMALAGYDAEKSMAMLPTVLNLAAAGGFELSRASDMVTDVQSALGLSIQQTETMVDQMAKTASKSNTSVEQLGDAMLTIGGTAKFMAGGTDRLQTVLGLLADNGIKGSEAGTHLRNMLLKLSSPTKDGTAALENLGVKVFDASGNMRDMQEIMLDMSQAMSNLTGEERVQAISDIFNARDLSAVNALLGTSKERWEQLGGAIAEATGSAQQMSQTQLGNLSGDITIMKSAVEGLKIQFSDGITPAIRDVVERITKALQRPKTQKFLREVGEFLGKVIKRITELVSNVVLPKVISLFDNGAKKLKIFGGVALGLVGTIKTVTTVMGLLGGTLSPTGLLIKGLGLLVGLFAAADLKQEDYINNMRYLSDAQRDLVDRVDDANEAHQETKQAYQDAALAAMQEKDKLQDLWGELKNITDENGNVKKGYEARANFIIGELNNALGTEYQMNDNIITQYQDMQKEIDNLIAKRAAESLLAAKEAGYTEALQGQEKALQDAAIAYQELTAAQSLAATYRTQEAQAIALQNELKQKGYTMDNHQMQELRFTEDSAREAAEKLELQVGKLTDTYQKANSTANDYYADIERYEKAQMLTYEGNYQEAQELLTKDYDYSLEVQRKKALNNKEEEKKYKEMLDLKRIAIEQYRRNLLAGEEGYNEEMLRKLIGAFNDEISEAKKAGLNVGTAIASGLSEAYSTVVGAAAGLMNGAIIAMNKVAGIHSPSRVGRSIGRNVGGSVGLGLDDAYDDTVDSAGNLMEGVLDELDNGFDTDTYITKTDTGTSDSVLGLLREIRDSMGFDVVLEDGTIAGRIDKLLGQAAMRKARGTA